MPERAYIVYKVSTPAPGPEAITYFGAQLNLAWNLSRLFINVKKCWHLDSVFQIGEFLHVNKKIFTCTFKLTF